MTDIINRAIDEAARDFRGYLSYYWSAYLNGLPHKPESPIEEALLLALYSLDLTIPVFAFAHDPRVNREHRLRVAKVTPQVTIEGYRVDFMVEVGEHRLALECDGFDFHDRTKEQAERDKSRDRKLTIAGVRVMRFTGREIYRSPAQCSYNVFQAVLALTPELDATA